MRTRQTGLNGKYGCSPNSAECCGPPGGPAAIADDLFVDGAPPSANRRGASVHARAGGGLQAVCPRRRARLGGRGAFLAARGADIKVTHDDSRATSFPAAGWRAARSGRTRPTTSTACVHQGRQKFIGTVSDADNRVEERRRVDSGKFERRGGAACDAVLSGDRRRVQADAGRRLKA